MQIIGRLSAVGAILVAMGVMTSTTPSPEADASRVVLTAGEEDIVIDIVRHGQRLAPYNELVTPSPAYPGAPLSELGHQQATDVGNQLFAELGPVAGIFEGQGVREMQTAAPFAALENMTPQVLPGLDEIDSGIFAGYPIHGPAGVFYQLPEFMWTLFGLELFPMPGASQDPNGVVLDANFTGAIDTMYSDAIADPVVSNNGDITVVGFNSEASVTAWVLLNVKNPDIAFFLPRAIESLINANEYPLLPNGGVVEIEGNPTDGWTLVSWDGTPIPQNPGLLTELVVDVRNPVIVEQTATWDIFEAFLTADPTTFENAVVTGVENVAASLVQLPLSIIDDIGAAIQNLVTDIGAAAVGDATAAISELGGAIPSLGTDLGAAAASEAAAVAGDVVASLF
ncbi:histidine phosphatase family protein [Mycobacterium sp. Lab-001]|uniref:histidine phosphatase family protein n=1 Tax=Mycobacterium sp. Lab-001 TaxID=3410136 RepID=UPI003D186CF2